jgi:hypothetical protein
VNGENLIGTGRLILTGWFLSGILASAAPATTPADTLAGSKVTTLSSKGAVSLSLPLAEILRLVKAGVDSQVIKAYIENSRTSYAPSAEELVTLKKLGVSDDILMAVLKRGTGVAEFKPGPPLRHKPALPPAYGPTSSYASWYPTYQPFFASSPPQVNTILYAPLGPMTTFNNSYPTFLNGRGVYAGYYVPGFGYLW